eukprot:FR740870.1.p1 GENE.FR740870.1~~FR740870.1.p1  ORF type:complete len:191 (+),score=31.84 FR740870.1:48-575(+)
MMPSCEDPDEIYAHRSTHSEVSDHQWNDIDQAQLKDGVLGKKTKVTPKASCQNPEIVYGDVKGKLSKQDGWNALGNDGELPDEILAKKDKDGLTDGDRARVQQQKDKDLAERAAAQRRAYSEGQAKAKNEARIEAEKRRTAMKKAYAKEKLRLKAEREAMEKERQKNRHEESDDE